MIATIGNTDLGWGWEGEFCTVGAGDGWITSEFFRQYDDHYGEEAFETLGHVYQQTQTSYINQFKDFTLPESWWPPDTGWDAIDQEAVEQWALLGDPSLKLGGYHYSLLFFLYVSKTISKKRKKEEVYLPISTHFL